ncbi:MAG: FAD-dependent oxidoreductase [Anaerolineales bacterium]|nr:FAD-dependent oxidoreductase [Anaerolineales bacterium]
MPSVDIAVVGAGPAGASAAIAAAQAGARVALIDEGIRLGGQFFRQPARPFNSQASDALRNHFRRGRQLLEQLDHPKIEVFTGATVWNLDPKRRLQLYGSHGRLEVRAHCIILATGATERSAAFPGWTLPGVMTAGAAQSLLKGHGLVPGGRVIVAGSGPLLLAVARQLLDHGAHVTDVVEATPLRRWVKHGVHMRRAASQLWEGVEHLQRLKRAGVGLHHGMAATRALGSLQVSGVEIDRVDERWRPEPGSTRQLAADVLCVSYGLIPSTELSRLAGCGHRFDTSLGAWVVGTDTNLETSQHGIYAAGETRGVGGAEAALAEGRLAGLLAAASLGLWGAGHASAVAEARAEQARLRAQTEAVLGLFCVQPGLADLATDETPVCRCEGVTAGAIRLAAREGARQLNSLKAWNRCGMGPCQGRTCGPIAAQIIASETGAHLEAAGCFTARPPIRPVPLSALAETATPHPTGTAMEDHAGYGRVVTGRR